MKRAGLRQQVASGLTPDQVKQLDAMRDRFAERIRGWLERFDGSASL